MHRGHFARCFLRDSCAGAPCTDPATLHSRAALALVGPRVILPAMLEHSGTPQVGPQWDGWVRTHDDAAQLLRYAALGATVILDPYRPRADRREAPATVQGTREYVLVLDAAPQHAVSARDMYSLPCKAAPLAARVRHLLDTARAQVRPLVVGRDPCAHPAE